ncbi:MAG TPA: sulfate ABC transporter substrate-binding protein [Gaiellaceae bacterium]|jgi:sulfate transport system substrate-binding protein
MSIDKQRNRIILAAAVAAALALAAGAAAHTTGTTLSLVGYSTPKAVMGKIVQAWQQTPAGKGVSFNQSYGASTDQARAVAQGLRADLVFLSTGDDVNLLVDAGLVDQDWDEQAYDGIAADTVVVFAVRPGNPKHIKSWADLVRPGIQVITPNPFSSGSAKWNILAAYGAERRLGKTDKQATQYVKQLFHHVVSQDSSGRNATNTFLSGKGDVLITYESEALNSRLNGQDIQYVIPRQTMLIQLPIAVLKSSPNVDKANQFIQYVKSDPAQDLLAQYGFRPVDPRIAKKYADKYPSRPGMFKVSDKYIGGWRAADKVWFQPSTGRMAKIEQAVGGPTAG